MTKSQMLQKRRQAAAEALEKGGYTVNFSGKENGRWLWQVANGRGSTYIVAFRRNNGEPVWECTCPDFKRRGAMLGRCKHTFLVEMYEKRRRSKAGNEVLRLARAIEKAFDVLKRLEALERRLHRLEDEVAFYHSNAAAVM